MESCLFYDNLIKKEINGEGRVYTQTTRSCLIIGSMIPGCVVGIETECPLVSKLGEKAYKGRNGHSPEENNQLLIDAQRYKWKIVRKVEKQPNYWDY